MKHDVFKVFYCYKSDCNTQPVNIQTVPMQQLKLVQFRLARKALASIEMLVKAMRHTGPFGGAPIEKINIKSLLKAAEIDSHSGQAHHSSQRAYFNSSKVVKVFFEDKYEKMKKVLVEQFIVEVLEIPDSMHGFECVSHPHLDNEASFTKYFDHWLTTTLRSFYYLLECSPLAAYFLNPCSSEEKEVANELRKRYNLIVDTVNSEPTKSPELPKADKSLEVLVKSKQYMEKLLIKMKLLNLQNYKDLLEEMRNYRKAPDGKLSGIYREYDSAEMPSWEERNRFFSDNQFPEDSLSASKPRSPYSRPLTGEKDDSLDLSASSCFSNTRPFKLHESTIEDRLLRHRRRISTDSNVSLMLKQAGRLYLYQDSQMLDLQGEMGMIDYLLSQQGEDTRETTTGQNKADIHSENSSKQGGSKPSSRKKPVRTGSQVGLASIGSQLLRSGTITDDYLELDEDDRLMDLCTTITEARNTAFKVDKSLITEDIPRAIKDSEPAIFVVNLVGTQKTLTQQDLTIGQWIDEISISSKKI